MSDRVWSGLRQLRRQLHLLNKRIDTWLFTLLFNHSHPRCKYVNKKRKQCRHHGEANGGHYAFVRAYCYYHRAKLNIADPSKEEIKGATPT